VQADAKFRSEPGDVGKLYVRSQTGKMIPLSNLVKLTPTTGAQTINHYNLLRSIEINGGAAPGFSFKEAIAAMAHIVKRVVPASMSYEWSGITTQEQASHTPATLIFGLGLLCIFLLLAAQYENYLDPLIIMLPVPLVILGALTAQSLRGLSNDVFSQMGLVMVMGLTCKNAILIVESANQWRKQGLTITKAAIQASQARLRPILLTALSTLLAIFPLVIAVGAGAASRQSLGTAVFGGILGGTFLSLFVVPILYIVLGKISDRIKPSRQFPF
jgi:HAE1 family hydrophobic/amphiphilic exporter-1